MRAPILIAAGLLTAVSACSRPASDSATDAADAPVSQPDLALTAPTGETPIASDMEMHRAQPAAGPTQHVRSSEPAAVTRPEREPLGVAEGGESGVASEPVAVETSHVHPKAAEPVDAVSAPAPGGGKPRTGVTEGLGPVPDRGWGGIGAGVLDDPNPLPGLIGRGGAVIIRGGAGGVDDDCALHRPGAGNRTGTGYGAGTLVNDRGPRGGTLINDRAPRTSGGGAFPRGGGMVRGGIR